MRSCWAGSAVGSVFGRGASGFALTSTQPCFVAVDHGSSPPTDAWIKYFYLINVVTAAAIFFSVLAILSALLVWPRSDLRTSARRAFARDPR